MENNNDKDFFACANEQSLEGLREFLIGRRYNMAAYSEPVQDKKGKYLVRLGWKVSLNNPKEPLQKRGLVWFPNLTLIEQAVPLFNQHMHTNGR